MPSSVEVPVLGRIESELREKRVLVSLGPVQNDIERVAVFKITCPEARRDDELLFGVSGWRQLEARSCFYVH